jgi:tRNA A37 threonylcarbamoyladenosine dehydratase
MMNDSRIVRLLGDDVMQILATKRVILFGVGGVGSWCAESLIRSGIQHLTIVDSDYVAPSNINRQLMALTSTVARPKVEVLRERLLDINPQADITALQEIYSAETARGFHLEAYNYVIDAIDSLDNKAHLLLTATATDACVFSAMGAALKLDPQRIRVVEFWKVKGCPLARALRNKFKHGKEFPQKKFLCVYSDEVMPNRGSIDEQDKDMWSDKKAQVNGTVCHAVAIFGFTLAGLVIQDIYNKTTI